MAISLESLRAAAYTFTPSRYSSILEAKRYGVKSAFLCHSHKDAELVRGLISALRNSDLTLYVDWQDKTMPDSPDRTTAERLQAAIVESDYFIFLATPNSVVSRWCPWEIGYADGKKSINEIFIVPTTDATGRHYGNEYLQLYRHIDLGWRGTLEFFEPGRVSGSPVSRL